MNIIAVDIDDVLSSQTDVIIAFSNSEYGTKLTREDLKRPGDYWGYYYNLWEVDKEEGAERFKKFLDEKYPLKQVIHKDTREVIRKLTQKFRLEIITSRKSNYQQVTLEWIEQHIPGVFDGVHFTDVWSKGEGAKKAKVCLEIGAGYLIDDNAEHCNLAAKEGINALLFGDFGWNLTKQLHQNVTRVRDWGEVGKYFGV